MNADRTRSRYVLCDACKRRMELGDLFVNVELEHGPLSSVICQACVSDMTIAIDEFLRKEGNVL